MADESLVAAVIMAETGMSYADYCNTPVSVLRYLQHLIPQKRALKSEPQWES